FDNFDAWRGPYGELPVSPLREKVIQSLPAGLVLVSDELHAQEHSLEAFIPFLQYPGFSRGGSEDNAGNPPAVEILPILVTRLSGELFDTAVAALADALREQFRHSDMRLGRDVVILISADCVHYGDEQWGAGGYAPFGVGEDGYRRAVDQDLDIIRASLTGPVDQKKVALFRSRVERDDLAWPYQVTWCGVYSIPFGLSVLGSLSREEGREDPRGILLGYSTSLDPGKLDLEGTGLGATNINTLRHWVGYSAIGYW
ncbi:MAG: AmmeMemoRadiSam system protein B, partial [Candidatus Krumholzibacteriota bacterium]|nr:AmmeMemoRadiSam system protein B [Candidatus Krumholzibacteriota bacterium]